MTARPEPIRVFLCFLTMLLIELYVWAMVITTIACVRPREAGEITEWAAASLAGAIWPVTVAIRIARAMRRGVQP
jgi:hypothetical protein